VQSDGEQTDPLPKRHAVRTMVLALHEEGIPVEAIRDVVPPVKLLPVDGSLSGEDLKDAFVAAHPNAEGNLNRWFFDSPIHEGETTWVLSKMWGTKTEITLASLAKLSNSGLRFTAEPQR
jgi:hypothetical protein